MPTRPDVISPAALRDWPLPGAGGSKHSRGHAVVVGASTTTPGAAMLAGIAALRVGAGVLALAVPEPLAIHIAVAIPEAGVSSLDNDITGLVEQADAVLVGPGLDDPDTTKRVVSAVVGALPDGIPLALDAFALGVLPQLPELHERLADRLVLTPNTSEAERLLGDDEPEAADLDDAETALALARRYRATVSYSGLIAAPGGSVREVATGHAGLGTSGSGDVLAGAVLGLLARGADPVQAASWATYLHAAAGDRLAARVGRLGFLARELADELPLVLTELQS